MIVKDIIHASKSAVKQLTKALALTRDTVKLVTFTNLFTRNGAEHHPEFFTSDSSRCPHYICKFS